jgi:CRP/FNR family cyclic AMP-dependent transcriptional regulator
MYESTRPSFGIDSFLATAGPGKRLLAIKASGIAFSQGDIADGIFFLHSGRVQLTVVSNRGKEATITLLAAGDFFGEEAMTGRRTFRTSTATIITNSTMLKIAKKEMIPCRS